MVKRNSVTTILIAGAILLVLTVVYFIFDARISSIFPACIFHSLTGFYCPGCGSQRAFSALLHAQLWQAVNYNLLFILVIPLLLYAALVPVVNIFRKKHIIPRLLYSTLFVKIFFVVVLVFFITRNLPFYPFNLLAPHAVG